jgi:hypothetical protein
VAVVLVMGASMPMYNSLGAGFCIAHVLLIPLLVDYGFRVLAVCIVRTKVRASPTGPRKGKWRWVFLPLLGLLLVSTHCSPWLLSVRFGLSRPAFERVVAGLESGTHTDRDGQRIGLYMIKEIRPAVRGGWEFETSGGLGDPVGFAYGTPKSARGRPYRRLAPDWYAAEW